MTKQEIQTLKNEALIAGDTAMADTCDAALAGDEDSLAECERAVADAAAMADDD